jgi:hypothetical protein
MSTEQPVIELFPGAEEHPFSSMMVELLRTNLRDHPSKLADFAAMSGRIALVAEDADAAVTLEFDHGRLSVRPGVRGIPDLVVRGSSGSLIDLSRIPPHPRLKFLPDVRSDAARAIGDALRKKELRVYGLLQNPGLGLRMSKVLSIY